MNVYTNFFKMLVILVIILLIIIVLKGNRESFFITTKPEQVKFNVEVNNSKTKIILKWDKQAEDVTDYIIFMYKNADGPHMIFPKNIDTKNDTSYNYEYLNPEINVRYSFGIAALNTNDISDIENYYEVLITPFKTNVGKIDNIKNYVYCNGNGKHILTSQENCENISEDIIAKTIIDEDDECNVCFEKNEKECKSLDDCKWNETDRKCENRNNFSECVHNRIMKNLERNNIIKFNLKF